MKTLCTLIAMALLTSSAFARLDETEEQCTARYGKVLKREAYHNGNAQGDRCSYEAGNFLITVYFLKDRAAVLMISKRGNALFSLDEINLLLGANSGNSTWLNNHERSPDMQTFHRSDDRANAVIIKMDQMMVDSVEYRAATLGMDKF